jgi:hypothetical protein
MAAQVLGGFRAPVKGEQVGDRGVKGGSGVGGMALSLHSVGGSHSSGDRLRTITRT